MSRQTTVREIMDAVRSENTKRNNRTLNSITNVMQDMERLQREIDSMTIQSADHLTENDLDGSNENQLTATAKRLHNLEERVVALEMAKNQTDQAIILLAKAGESSRSQIELLYLLSSSQKFINPEDINKVQEIIDSQKRAYKLLLTTFS